MKVQKDPKLFIKGCIIDDDGLFKLVDSTLIRSVCDATITTKHGHDDTSLDNVNVILISPNKSMGCLDLVGN